MAGIINNILLKFNEQGADQTVAATENVNKATTRLGNTSAANGRQFAAQSQGLGGLVAAYAGAAATSFALQQAFAALQKAAQFDQIIQGTNTFSSQFGQSADSVISSIKRITQGQLSIVDAAQTANLALSAGFNPKQINELADVATKASRALGRDLNDSYQRVIKGAAKLEPELLDELGIFTRIEPAVEKYSAAVGKSSSSLSEFERRQAFVNAVIAEGQSKFSIIDTSTATAAQSYSKLGATLTDLAYSIGNVLANALAPLADYISGNASAAFGAFGVIVTLILGKLNQLSTDGLEKLTKRITDSSNALSTNFLGSGKLAAESIDNLSKSTLSYSNQLGAGLGPQKAARNELINLAKAGEISINQTKQLNAILTTQIAKEEASIAVLNAKKLATNATAAAIAKYDIEIAILNRSLTQNIAVQTAATSVLEKQTIAAKAASLAVAGFGKAVGFIGSAITGALKFVNALLLLTSVAGLLGPTFLSYFKLEGLFDKWSGYITQIAENFLGLDKNSKQFDVGVKGVAASLTESAFQAENVKASLEGAVKTTTAFGVLEVKINAETIQRDVAKAINDGYKAADKAQQAFQDTLNQASDSNIQSKSMAQRLAGGRVTPGQKALQDELTILEAVNTAQDQRVRKQMAYNESVQQTINGLEERKKEPEQTANTIKLLDVEIRALRQVIDLGKEQAQIGGLIADITGISAKRAYELVKVNEDGSATLQTTNGQLQIQFYTLDQINKLEASKRAGAREVNEINAKTVAISSNLLSDTEKLQKAQLDLNGIAKTRSDLVAAEEALQKQIKDIQASKTPIDKERLAAAEENLKVLKSQREEYNKLASVQESILRIQDATRKTFSSQINSLNNITGLVDGNGKIATTELEVNRNQLDILNQQVAAGDALRKSIPIPEGETLESTFEGTELAIINASNSAKQALAGSIIEVIKKVTQLTTEYEKQTLELQKQALSIRLGVQKDQLTLQQQINDKTKEFNAITIQNQLNAIERQKTTNQLAAERINILRQGREEEAKSQMSGVLSPLFTDKNKREIEIKFKQEELNDLKKALGAQVASAAATLQKEKELADLNRKSELEALTTQKDIFSLDSIAKAAEIAYRIEDTKRQLELFNKQKEAVQEQIKVLMEHPVELAKVFNQFIRDFAEITKITNPDKAAQIDKQVLGSIKSREDEMALKVKDQLKTSEDRLTTGSQALSAAYANLLDALKTQGTAVDETNKKQEEANAIQKRIVETRYAESVAASQAKYNNVLAETGNKLLAAQQALDILKREAERANNSFVILAVKSAEAITNNIEKSLNSLVDAIASGTLTMENFKQGFKQMIVSILSDITKALVNEVITKPIKEMVFGFTRDLISGMTGSTAADALSKGVGSTISDQLTKNVGDVGKVATGLKDVGVTSVYIMGAAPGVMCCSGQGAAEAAAGGTAAKAAGEGAAAKVGEGVTRPAIVKAADASTDIVTRKVTTVPITPTATEVKLDNTKPLEVTTVTPSGQSALSPDYMGGDFGVFRKGGLAQTAPGGVTTINPDVNAPNAYGGLSTNLQSPNDPFGMSTSAQAVIPQGIDSKMLTDPNYLFNRDTTGQLTPGGAGWMTQGRNPATGGDYTPGPGTENLTGGGPQIETAGFEEALDRCKESTEGLTGGFEGFTKSLGLGDKGVASLADQTELGAASQQAFGSAVVTNTGLTEVASIADGLENGATQQSATTLSAEFVPAVFSATAALKSMAGGGGGGGGLLGGLGGGGGVEEAGVIDLNGFAASGGLIRGSNYSTMRRFAAGGGVMMRDSVPSLLEPGEFVMKKSSVDSIGKNSLERMNATGRSSAPTNIKVQVDNSGQPKQAEQGETQFDGETAIVKLILKDLNSNGPIRRSIRGNV